MKTIKKFISQKCIGYKRERRKLCAVIRGLVEFSDGTSGFMYYMDLDDGLKHFWQDEMPKADVSIENLTPTPDAVTI